MKASQSASSPTEAQPTLGVTGASGAGGSGVTVGSGGASVAVFVGDGRLVRVAVGVLLGVAVFVTVHQGKKVAVAGM